MNVNSSCLAIPDHYRGMNGDGNHGSITDLHILLGSSHQTECGDHGARQAQETCKTRVNFDVNRLGSSTPILNGNVNESFKARRDSADDHFFSRVSPPPNFSTAMWPMRSVHTCASGCLSINTFAASKVWSATAKSPESM